MKWFSELRIWRITLCLGSAHVVFTCDCAMYVDTDPSPDPFQLRDPAFLANHMVTEKELLVGKLCESHGRMAFNALYGVV